jgi:hypothetical protein
VETGVEEATTEAQRDAVVRWAEEHFAARSVVPIAVVESTADAR